MKLLRRPARAGLPERLDALATAVEDGAGRLPSELLDHVQGVVERAGQRRQLSTDHTVVALAGATGSGKSSIFNSAAGIELARVGVRRPTTGEPLACVWGTEGVSPLLEWLGIPLRHRIPKESILDTGEDDALDGLVLLDLPDNDSTEQSHRAQVDRLVEMVDLFVWVLDPQKYADAVLHERYLRPLSGHAAVTVIVLNQVDLLSPDDLDECMRDLRRLLTEDGLPKVPVIPMSAHTGAGMEKFLTVLREAVVRRKTADDRVAADVRDAATRLLSAAGEGEPAGIGDDDRRRLVDALAHAAGVDVVADAVGRSYRRRAGAATGWPVTRWLARFRSDPLRRLRLDRTDVDAALVRTSLPAATPVQRARSDSAIRRLGDSASRGVAGPWVAAIRSAVNTAADRLPDALDQAVVSADLGVERRPRWWIVVNVLQWLGLAAALVGGAWLVALAVVGYLQLPEIDTPGWGSVPLPTALLLGGVLLGILLAVGSRIAARIGAERRADAVRRKLRVAVGTAADEVVVAPVDAEIDRYRSFRQAALVARG
ncbi:MAG TPA: YfjP family GTPase [Jiangellaceae bacterium]|nr:YfjP family GTPase [Jiangellaceae bacterium]